MTRRKTSATPAGVPRSRAPYTRRERRNHWRIRIRVLNAMRKAIDGVPWYRYDGQEFKPWP